MSVNLVDKNTGALTRVAGNADDSGIGNLAALTTTDKSSLVGAVNEVKSGLIDLNYTYTAVEDHGNMDADTYYKIASISLGIGVYEGFFHLNKRGSGKKVFTVKIEEPNGNDFIMPQYVYDGRYIFVSLPFRFHTNTARTVDIYIKSDQADGLAFGGYYIRKAGTSVPT